MALEQLSRIYFDVEVQNSFIWYISCSYSGNNNYFYCFRLFEEFVRNDTGKTTNWKKIIKELLVKKHKVQIETGENM